MSNSSDPRHAVHDVMHRYALAIDTQRWEDLVSVFAPSITADFRSFGAREVWEGPGAGWVEQVKTTIAGMDATQHAMSNHLYDVESDVATGTTYIQARHVCNNEWGDNTYTIGGHYEVRMVSLDGAWRISAYTLVCTWHEGNRQVLKAAMRKAAT